MVYKFKHDNIFGKLKDGKMIITLNLHKEKSRFAWPVGMAINPVMELWEVIN